jgi:tryptophan 2,3-dioxygenase
MVKIWNMIIDQLQLLESMTPMEFLEFRNYITPASGFQSLQFRTIEMKLGLTDQFRSAYKTEHFTRKMFKGEQANQLEIAVKEDSLLCQIEVIHETVIRINNFHK